jgi:hypothetical protein
MDREKKSESASERETKRNPDRTRGMKSEFWSMDRHLLSTKSNHGRSYYKERKKEMI